MSDELYDGPCEAGCQHFHGGEIRHHPDCGHYPHSITKLNADHIEALEAENKRLRDALQNGLSCLVGDAVGLEWKRQSNQFIRIARAALEGDKQ